LEGLKNRAISSVKWTTFQTLVSASLAPILQIIKARYLSPKDFSYLAIIMICIGLSNMLKNFGISQAIIQRSEITKEENSTLFLFNTIFSIFLYILIFMFADLIAKFFSLPDLAYFLKLSSIVIVVSSPSLLFRAFLEKSLFFKEISLVAIINNILIISITTIFLISGLGLISIIYGNILSTLISTLMIIFISHKHKLVNIKLYFNFKNLYPFLKFGFYITAKQLLNFSSGHIDEIIIGHFMPPETLGFYYFGKNLLFRLRNLISAPFSKVIFPIFSKLKDNKERLCLNYQKLTRYIAIIAFPFFLGIALTAHLFVPLLFGEKWSGSIIVFQVLSIALIFAMLNANISTSLLYSLNKPDIVFHIDLIISVLYFFFLFIFARRRINFILIILLIRIVVMFIVLQYFANKQLSYNFFTYLFNLKNIYVSSFCMVSLIFIFQNYFFIFSTKIVQFGSSVICGAVIYIICLWVLEKETILELKNFIKI
jgi:O-antigen/teichoic acid export membrane protein